MNPFEIGAKSHIPQLQLKWEIQSLWERRNKPLQEENWQRCEPCGDLFWRGKLNTYFNFFKNGSQADLELWLLKRLLRNSVPSLVSQEHWGWLPRVAVTLFLTPAEQEAVLSHQKRLGGRGPGLPPWRSCIHPQGSLGSWKLYPFLDCFVLSSTLCKWFHTLFYSIIILKITLHLDCWIFFSDIISPFW